eukprot:sb/3468219/
MPDLTKLSGVLGDPWGHPWVKELAGFQFLSIQGEIWRFSPNYIPFEQDSGLPGKLFPPSIPVNRGSTVYTNFILELLIPLFQGTKRVAHLASQTGMSIAIVHIGETDGRAAPPSTANSTISEEGEGDEGEEEEGEGDGEQGGFGKGGITLVGNVEGKDCIIYDDIADACVSLVRAASYLKSKGALRVFVMATHGLFTEEGLQLCNDSEIDEFVVTDTIDQTENLQCYPNCLAAPTPSERTVENQMGYGAAIQTLRGGRGDVWYFNRI